MDHTTYTEEEAYYYEEGDGEEEGEGEGAEADHYYKQDEVVYRNDGGKVCIGWFTVLHGGKKKTMDTDQHLW